MAGNRSKPVLLFIALGIVTAFVAIFSAILMTEPGQSLNLPRSWIVHYYSYHWLYIALTIGLLGALWFINLKHRICRNLWAYLATAGVFACIIAANFLLPTFFPSYQHDANYVSVTEADKFLSDDEIIYAVEINGETRGFPREHLVIPHIAGAEIGGEKIIMTFCALSNLPLVINQDIGHGESDIGIIIQVHNNLVMVDRESGELVQQITAKTEFSNKKLKTYANEMMPWKSFKKLHPDATVFKYEFHRLLDAFLLNIFEGPLEKHFSEDHGPIFPTLSLEDKRVPNKEKVWGLELNNSHTAFTRSFMEKNPVYRFEFGGKPLVIIYDKDLDIVALFDRTVDGVVTEPETVDVKGNSPQGRLHKVPMFNGVLWMVWAHWFPDTEIVN